MNDYSILAQLFGAYLHQDWDVDFSSVWEAVRMFRETLSPNEVASSIDEIDTLDLVSATSYSLAPPPTR